MNNVSAYADACPDSTRNAGPDRACKRGARPLPPRRWNPSFTISIFCRRQQNGCQPQISHYFCMACVHSFGHGPSVARCRARAVGCREGTADRTGSVGPTVGRHCGEWERAAIFDILPWRSSGRRAWLQLRFCPSRRPTSSHLPTPDQVHILADNSRFAPPNP